MLIAVLTVSDDMTGAPGQLFIRETGNELMLTVVSADGHLRSWPGQWTDIPPPRWSLGNRQANVEAVTHWMAAEHPEIEILGVGLEAS